MKKRRNSSLPRRVLALLSALVTLWGVTATAGAMTAREAYLALMGRESAAVSLLRNALGDYFSPQPLQLSTAIVVSQSPALLAAKDAILPVWESLKQKAAPMPEDTEEEGTVLQETDGEGLPPLALEENGVPWRTLTPTSPAGYTVAGLSYIANSTDHALDAAALLAPFAASLGEEDPQVLIIHTHGSEAYTMPQGQAYTPSGDWRTADTNYNVVRIGDEMAKVFAANGISVLHDRTLYDAPEYNGAYGRSLTAIEDYLARYPSISFVLDIHRDAVSDGEGNAYKVISPTESGNAAQISLVIGTDGGGLPHDHWQENLKLAVAVQNAVLTDYPTLMRPITLRNSRYNQHATCGSLLIEMGAAGNSLDEALLSARLFTEKMAEVMKK
ncbi:MAG: stage II sporulation protein P [Oscillospiraceae bacterium]|nr:stage II sporulation protein P [Oscillospiraceae bacterium]